MTKFSCRDIQEKAMSETQIIRLLDPLPCSVWAPGGTCGRPAVVAFCWPAPPARGMNHD